MKILHEKQAVMTFPLDAMGAIRKYLLGLVNPARILSKALAKMSSNFTRSAVYESKSITAQQS